MKYPLWLRIAIQNGEILYFDIVQQRYQNSLHKKYKSGFSLSENLRDILVIPNEYRQGNYFCDLYYDHQSFQTVFTEYHIPERKRIEFNDFHSRFKPRVDYQYVENLQQRIKGKCDEIIFTINGIGTHDPCIRNGLQTNVLLWEHSCWFSYHKPDFITAELERLVAEKRVRLVDNPMYEATKMMFINEFEPFDPARALPFDETTAPGYPLSTNWSWKIFGKWFLLFLIVLLFLLMPIFMDFERHNNDNESITALLGVPAAIFCGIVCLFFVRKLEFFNLSKWQYFREIYIKTTLIFTISVIGYMIMRDSLIPHGQFIYTIAQEKIPMELQVTDIIKTTHNLKPDHRLDSYCRYALQLHNEFNQQNYYVCVARKKTAKIGDRYKMNIQESSFGYRLTDIEKVTY